MAGGTLEMSEVKPAFQKLQEEAMAHQALVQKAEESFERARRRLQVLP